MNRFELNRQINHYFRVNHALYSVFYKACQRKRGGARLEAHLEVSEFVLTANTAEEQNISGEPDKVYHRHVF